MFKTFALKSLCRISFISAFAKAAPIDLFIFPLNGSFFPMAFSAF
jgi:hypothetical protein